MSKQTNRRHLEGQPVPIFFHQSKWFFEIFPKNTFNNISAQLNKTRISITYCTDSDDQ